MKNNEWSTFRRSIPINKGHVENTMDKALIITFVICVFVILFLTFTSYFMYKDTMDSMFDPNYDGPRKESDLSYVISEKGEIIIDGKPFIPEKSADEYTYGDYMYLGASVLNKEIINIGKQDKTIFAINDFILYISIGLFIYWIILLYKFEKEKECSMATEISDEELFKKYNPLIMGCIEGNRNVVHSDIIAVIFGLINKKIIELKLIPVNEKKTMYDYKLIRNKSNEVNIPMDEIERYVHCLLFGEPGYDKDEADLIKFVEEFSHTPNYGKKLKKLQKLANKKLHSLGANKAKVPSALRAINSMIFGASLLVTALVIWNCVVNIELGTWDIVLMYFGMMVIGFAMPILIVLLYIGVIFVLQTTKIMRRIMDKLVGKPVLGMTIFVVTVFATLLAIILTSSITPLIIPYVLMLCVSFLIMKTDNLMMQNDEEILMDYNRMKMVKEKVRDYSLLNKRDIEDIKLWEMYMTYAVSFGVAKKAIRDSDTKFQFESIDKGYLLDLVLDVVEGFIEVNF